MMNYIQVFHEVLHSFFHMHFTTSSQSKFLCSFFLLAKPSLLQFFQLLFFLEIYSLCVFFILSCCNITFLSLCGVFRGTIFFSSPRSMPQYLFMTFCCDFFLDFSSIFFNFLQVSLTWSFYTFNIRFTKLSLSSVFTPL